MKAIAKITSVLSRAEDKRLRSQTNLNYKINDNFTTSETIYLTQNNRGNTISKTHKIYR